MRPIRHDKEIAVKPPPTVVIYPCQLNGANPFEYLTELLRHSDELAASPERWMPWNYREALR
jgi:hypothetical protein